MALNAGQVDTRTARVSGNWQVLRRSKETLLEGGLACLVLLFSLWMYAPWLVTKFNPYDLGIASYNAIRVGSGYVPYTDMYLIYGPGAYYLRAALFAIFGASIATMQAEFVILCAACVTAGYWCLRVCVGRIGAIALAATIAPFTIIAFPIHAATYCAMLVTLGCFARFVALQQRHWLVATGMAIGATVAGRWDFGVYLTLVVVAILCCLPTIRAWTVPAEVAAPFQRSLIVHLGWLLIPAGLAALPAYLPTLLTDPGAFLHTLNIARAAGMARILPYPVLPNPTDLIAGKIDFTEFFFEGLFTLPANAFLVLGPLNAVVTLAALRLPLKERPPIALIVNTLTMTLYGGALYSYGRGRPDLEHTAPMTTFMLLSLPLLIWCLARPTRRLPVLLCRLRWGLLALILIIVVPSIALSWTLLLARHTQSSTASTFAAPRLAGMTTDSQKTDIYDALIRSIQRRVAPNEYIFSGLTRHDRIYFNDVLLYFAAARQAGVRDYHMDPGTTTTREIQQRIIHDLQANHVRLIVLADFGLSTEPNGSSQSSGVTDLDEYIRANYAVVERFGAYLVLLPRAEASVSSAVTLDPLSCGAIDSAATPFTAARQVKPDGLLRIIGWAATPAGMAPLSTVEVRVNDYRVPTVQQCLPRDDLAARFGPEARYGSYEVMVDLLEIPSIATGPLAIAVDVIDRDGQHHPQPPSTIYVNPIVAP